MLLKVVAIIKNKNMKKNIENFFFVKYNSFIFRILEYTKKFMNNNILGLLIVLAGVGTIFIDHSSAWIVSAILIGAGQTIFLER